MTNPNTNTNTNTIEPREPLDGLGRRAGEIKDAVVEQVGARVDSLEGWIKKHPLAALGIGFGIGYLVARMFHR